MPLSTREAARSLAAQQGGYFTAKQAKGVGYGYRHLDYHETAGNFERVDHGLYRLPTVPVSEHDELPELSELLPREIHLTVPPRFRKHPPHGCVLHKAIRSEKDVAERAGFRVTSPLRTLLDAAEGQVSQEQLAKAVEGALSRGLVRQKALESAARHSERLTLALGGKKAKR